MYFSVEKSIQSRTSVRSYDEQIIENITLDKIHDFIQTLTNPFGGKVRMQLLAQNEISKQKLGTYGVIQGASYFIGAAVEKGDLALASLGYELEELVLFLTSLGLGTCWLGGTFNRSNFAKAMDIKDNEVFPIVTPIGYPSGRKHIIASFARKMAKSDSRKAWETLFFDKSFSTPLSPLKSGEFMRVLENVRLAPSASNYQPWRILRIDNYFHFFEAKSNQYSKASFDVQQIDLGIAACHFDLSAREIGLSGKFDVVPNFSLDEPENTHYLFSWAENSKPD